MTLAQAAENALAWWRQGFMTYDTLKGHCERGARAHGLDAGEIHVAVVSLMEPHEVRRLFDDGPKGPSDA